ncbi:MAG: serine hydrolase domain-containing protein [Kofleriaceae bacterium]
MSHRYAVLLLALACSGGHKPVPTPKPAADADPDGPHRDAVAAQLRPYLDGEVMTGVVVGLIELGKIEIYGFGVGPGGKPPNGRTLFDLGSMTKVYTGLLLADAVQRREVDLEAPIADLMPPGVTVPTRDGVAITAKHLALHSSGLPLFPPSLVQRKTPPDPFAGYGDDAFYQDVIATQLVTPPGKTIELSHFGTGLLAVAVGRKIGTGYAKALGDRVLAPLALRDTVLALPAGAAARRAIGTDDELKPISRWTWGALAGAGGLISDVRDLLLLVDAELDAAAGSKGTLRAAMRLSQEPQLDAAGDNEALGWNIDGAGRLWHDGSTGGFRGFIGFDPKTKRGVVVLASTQSALVDTLGRTLFDILDGTAKPPAAAPTAATLATYAGTYDFSGTDLLITANGKRLYLEGPGEPRHRMAPIGDRTFWIEGLKSAAKFEVEASTVKALVFKVGAKQIVAARKP